MKTDLYSPISGQVAMIMDTPIYAFDKKQIPLGTKALRRAILTLAAFLFFFSGKAQIKEYRDCCEPAFGSATFYYSVQPGSNYGFGMEAGKWNKESSRFSYFLGTRMQWYHQALAQNNKGTANPDIEKFYLYLKGQCLIIKSLYLVASPQIVNLNSFDAAVGLRYVVPIGSIVGLGAEPSYSFVGKQVSLNLNMHLSF